MCYPKFIDILTNQKIPKWEKNISNGHNNTHGGVRFTENAVVIIDIDSTNITFLGFFMRL